MLLRLDAGSYTTLRLVLVVMLYAASCSQLICAIRLQWKRTSSQMHKSDSHLNGEGRYDVRVLHTFLPCSSKWTSIAVLTCAM
eukprot:1404043-Amphidinium_carterae.1